MKKIHFLALLSGLLFLGATRQPESFVCTPCGDDCDLGTYSSAGTCPHCGMPLVKRSTVNMHNITPLQLCDSVKAQPGVLLLDVRTTEEFSGKDGGHWGHLRNAMNIPVQELARRLNELSAYRSKTVIVYCSHGHRSAQATYLLSQNGFRRVSNMLGGMCTWNKATEGSMAARQLVVR